MLNKLNMQNPRNLLSARSQEMVHMRQNVISLPDATPRINLSLLGLSKGREVRYLFTYAVEYSLYVRSSNSIDLTLRCA